MNRLNILLVGLGNMGKIHKRVIESNNNTNLVGVVDSSFKKKLELHKLRVPMNLLLILTYLSLST